MTETSSSHPAARWAYRSAGELAQSLVNKEISALELTDQFIARIEALDGDLNAVPVRDFARAREAAREADAALGARRAPAAPRRARHDQGIVQRRRIADDLGHTCRQGIYPSRGRARGRAPQGRRAPSSSARPMCLSSSATGKATTTSTASTNNPWDKTRTPGGSSGGSSAALAAGFGPLSLGSDIGGSLRVPAHFCGVCAHKPTHGLVASRGHVPPGVPAWPGGVDLAVIGPMARSVDDLILALDIIAGPDEAAEGRAYRLSLPPARGEKLADFRVLVHRRTSAPAHVSRSRRFARAFGETTGRRRRRR